tara:strand:+ start:1971 stop:2258 length:288 start_codon:yes stop_codon:yes gene_type:complete
MSKISYNKVREIIEKEYNNKELSYWDKILSKTLSGNIGSVGNMYKENIMNVMDDWLTKQNKMNIKIGEGGNLYNYEESMEDRITRLYKEMERIEN